MCVWLAFIVVFGLALFPPWVQTNTSYSAWPTQRWKLGHAPFSPSPAPPDRRSFIEVDYPRMLTEIGVAECFVLALYLTWGRTLPKRISSPPPAPESKEQIQEDVDGLIAALRQNLRIKVGWDESKIDRLIEYERERLGNVPLQTLMGAAIERWERDNR
jgi:hypothetical protein